MKDQTFGERLRNLREERGLTLQQLSMRSGIHQSTISRLETDAYRRPHIETFIQLANGLEISVQELAILTNLVEPSSEEIVIKDKLLKKHYHLLDKQNLMLLKQLENIDATSKYHLIQFLQGIQNVISQ
ncbi:MAG: helix-turn-helix domain-containing protein [Halanaerobiales bacterium]|nr:helix-turn-helix domain-containing protein [Halanaerobiales bacterium]